MVNPAIIVPAYDRPQALGRLLACLDRARYLETARLIIAVDAGGVHNAEVKQVAENFHWRHGQKLTIHHERPLGLIGNVFFCGDLSQQFGPIILLEDDLVVSPSYYEFACQALRQFDGDQRIGGVSLNALWFNGFKHWPFIPYLDESDLFFLQVALSHGQVYSQEQWQRFAAWRSRDKGAALSGVDMHPLYFSFPSTDWFPLKTRYLVETGQFYAFPRQSLSANSGEMGTHFSYETDFFQVPLQNHRRTFRMSGMDDSIAVYDSYQEMLPGRIDQLTSRLEGYDYVVDLNASRDLDALPTDYILTTRPCENALLEFGMSLRPLVANVIEGTPGSGISLSKSGGVKRGRMEELRTEKRLQQYYWRGRPGLRKLLQLRLLGLLELFDKD